MSKYCFLTAAQKLGRVVRTNAFQVVFRVRYSAPHVSSSGILCNTRTVRWLLAIIGT